MTISSIYKNARDGRLNEESLNQYIKLGEDINAASGNKQYTPLMAAVLNGHKNTVKLLLSNKADVDRQAPSGETALWVATSNTRRNRLAIVSLLLVVTPRPNLNVQPKIGSRNTPLMQAIVRFGDTKVASLLVNAGASLGALNLDGKTANELVIEVQSHKLALALPLLDEKMENQVPTTTKNVKFIAYVIFWLSMIFTFIFCALRALKGYFGASSSQSVPVSKLEKPMSLFPKPDDFKAIAAGHVSGINVERFSSQNNESLQKLIEDLVVLENRKSPLNTQENLKALILLKLYQPIFYCDDSSFMTSPTIQNMKITRKAAQKDIV
ncbi:hypothetical protein N7520_002787 [Penicillium odoratum]|uniref:uncharacterized protein n=1 Tax=Penicillium odoratum TaxID=1167516 RepID=UPI002546914F|nr:uncharacterized protein N7520_002787 [Penicillium odoratum]KAJ5772258.1 hypothetical protein N7520_002787 [Penicillium odoratum]